MTMSAAVSQGCAVMKPCSIFGTLRSNTSSLRLTQASASALRPVFPHATTTLSSSQHRRHPPACSSKRYPTSVAARATLQDSITSTSTSAAASSSEGGTPAVHQCLLSLAASSPLAALALLAPPQAFADVIAQVAADDFSSGSYSQASYYASLALFIISIPGLWSLIKRATKSKIVRRTFEVPGPATVAKTGGKSMAQVAGEITSFLNQRNYRVSESKDVVTFVGDIAPNRSQAAFLVFCTFLSLASVALVLSITNPDVGEWWYSIVALSPLAGVYYWRKAERTETLQVKIVISDDEKTADITIQGDDEEIEQLRRQMGMMEKGLEYIKGVLEG